MGAKGLPLPCCSESDWWSRDNILGCPFICRSLSPQGPFTAVPDREMVCRTPPPPHTPPSPTRSGRPTERPGPAVRRPQGQASVSHAPGRVIPGPSPTPTPQLRGHPPTPPSGGAPPGGWGGAGLRGIRAGAHGCGRPLGGLAPPHPPTPTSDTDGSGQKRSVEGAGNWGSILGTPPFCLASDPPPLRGKYKRRGGPQYGQGAVSALGSGRACPATVIAFCPEG